MSTSFQPAPTKGAPQGLGRKVQGRAHRTMDFQVRTSCSAVLDLPSSIGASSASSKPLGVGGAVVAAPALPPRLPCCAAGGPALGRTRTRMLPGCRSVCCAPGIVGTHGQNPSAPAWCAAALNTMPCNPRYTTVAGTPESKAQIGLMMGWPLLSTFLQLSRSSVQIRDRLCACWH